MTTSTTNLRAVTLGKSTTVHASTFTLNEQGRPLPTGYPLCGQSHVRGGRGPHPRGAGRDSRRSPLCRRSIAPTGGHPLRASLMRELAWPLTIADTVGGVLAVRRVRPRPRPQVKGAAVMCALWALAALGLFGLVVALVAGRVIDEMGGDEDQSCPRCDDLEAELQRIIAEGRS